ncbi:MAG: ABC transporter permease [Gemmatimonadota bacterium]|nr:ABC transporter permease [Gemmatimonadota bacterium]
MPRPPRAAEALLTLFLPANGVRESVLGDLHEMFLERVRGRPGARTAATRWYWGQALRLAGGYAVRRIAGNGARGFGTPASPAEVGRPEIGGGDGMRGMIRQLRLSTRSLLKSPGFTLPALFILAVGMTAGTAIFTVVDSILLRPLDLPDSERLVMVCEDHPRQGDVCIASPGNVEDFRLSVSSLSELGIVRGWPFTLGDGGESEGVRGGLASASALRAVGVTPALGRLFRDDEHGPSDDKVILLSHAYWSARFGADSSVMGRTVSLSGVSHEVVGVLPAGFDLPFDLAGIEVWKPPHVDPLDPEVRDWRGFRAIGRLAEGSNVAAAASELSRTYSALAEIHESIDAEWRLRVQPLLRVVVGDTRTVLLAFLGAAGLLLLIVCANVANLLLARGLNRRREIAVRTALGAGRSRLVGEILVEGLLLSAAASAIAVLGSRSAVAGLVSLAPPGIPRLEEVSMDVGVLAFVVVLAVVVTLFFATLPALRVSSWELSQALKGSARSGRDSGSRRLQSAFVVTELALSVMLVAGAAMLTRSFIEYARWDPGFDPERRLAVSAFFDPGKYASRSEFVPVIRRGEEMIAALPGVVSVATASAGPLFGGGDGASPFLVEGADPSGPAPSARWFDIGPDFFATLGVPLVRGREFTESDTQESPRVAIVNEAFARIAWPAEDPLGRRVRLPEIGGLELEVIGVAADVAPMEPGEVTYPEIYWSNRQLGRLATFYLVRAEGDLTSLSSEVQAALERTDPDVSLGTPWTLSAEMGRALVRPRFQAIMLVSFALVALVLASVGVYSVVSYAVANRTREVGVRMALGASGNEILSLVVRSTAAVAGLGLVLGLAGAALVGRLVQGLTPGVSAIDPISLSGAAAVLTVATGAAVLVPARRAARLDPTVAMRAED